MDNTSDKKIESIHDITQYYQSINPQENLYVGIELERSGVYRDTLKPVQFDGEGSYMSLMVKLEEEVGWEVIERDEIAIYAMQRGDTQITTEADGRPELTGSPKEHLHDLTREYRLHEHELKEIGDVFNIAWLPVGFHPFATNDEISFVPKVRYQVFTDIHNGPWMHTWLKRMNGIHMNFSVTTEENAIIKAQTAFRILPIISAMYANSCFQEGRLSEYLNTRRAMMYDNPPLRLDIPKTILDPTFSYEEWIQHSIDMPIVILKKSDGSSVHPGGIPFTQWMKDGYEGQYPTLDDFDQHIKGIWSDIRMRPSYIEYRVADSLPLPLALSVPALMKGLMFDSESWDAVEHLTKDWTYDDVLRIDRESWKTGLQTEVKGKKLLTYAQELITIANDKLHKFERTDAQEEDESIYLTPLKEQIYIKEKSPAEELVELYEGEWNGDLSRIVEWCETE